MSNFYCEKCENSENKNIHCWDCLCVKLNIVKQQNKQMREALEKIVKNCTPYGDTVFKDIAQQALKGGE